MSLTVGELFAGRYLVQREVGRGGMGMVFEAHDRTLDRVVAVKVLQGWLATPEFIARFEREASVLARMRSPHILAIYDFGTDGDTVYLVTPYLPDGDLAQWLKLHGPLPRPQALRVVSHLAEALADAHEHGVVHRDVKPANVLLWRRRTRLLPFLCDFGIAKDQRNDQRDFTRTNAVIGSTSYMAPERHRGEEASQAADVYALGCLLWAALTGQAPYLGTEYEVMTGHLQGDVPALPVTDHVDEGINALLASVMAKDPAERTISAELVGERLARLAGLDPTDATLLPGSPPPPPGRLDEAVEADLVSEGVAEATPTPTPPPPTVVRSPTGPPPPPPVPPPASPSRPPRGRRFATIVAAAALVVAATVGVAIAVSGGGGGSEPDPRAGGTTSSEPDPSGSTGATTEPTDPATTAAAVVPPGPVVVKARSTYRSVSFDLTPPAGATPTTVRTEVRPTKGGAWQPVPGSTYVADVVQGGDRTCASFRAVAVDGAAPGPAVSKCGRAKPRTVELVPVDAECTRSPLPCSWYDVRVTGFKPGSRPQAFMSYTNGTKFCTCEFHVVDVDRTGRGLQDGKHAGHDATSRGEWWILDDQMGKVILLEVDGVRRTYEFG